MAQPMTKQMTQQKVRIATQCCAHGCYKDAVPSFETVHEPGVRFCSEAHRETYKMVTGKVNYTPAFRVPLEKENNRLFELEQRKIEAARQHEQMFK
jgi:hypothetical protein